MKLFRTDNTEGYTQNQLDSLNEEWDQIISDQDYDDNYDQKSKNFCDEVARR